jgi:Ca2+/Na+ antiporter
VAAALEFFAPERELAIFITSGIAIVPLAAYIGRATDSLAKRFGGGIGGLLNATFGNAAELIIGVLALRRGFTDLVKASLTGSIIGNVLLVFGLCAFVGGVRHPVQRFNRTAAGLGSTMLLLSAIGLTVPAVFHQLSRGRPGTELRLDTEIAVVLFLTYIASLVFTLKTHRAAYATGVVEDTEASSHWPAVATLLGATAGVAWMSELLVGTVSTAAHQFGMSNLFVGVVVIAVIGNAAEHFSAGPDGVAQPDGRGDRYRPGLVDTDRALRRARARVCQLRDCTGAHEPSIHRIRGGRGGPRGALDLDHRARWRNALDGGRTADGRVRHPRTRFLLSPQPLIPNPGSCALFCEPPGRRSS